MHNDCDSLFATLKHRMSEYIKGDPLTHVSELLQAFLQGYTELKDVPETPRGALPGLSAAVYQ